MAEAHDNQLPEFDTVVLAGGRAMRMGGKDKPRLPVGGQPMLVLVARAAAAAGTRQLIVVGPRRGGAVGRGLADVASAAPGGLVCVSEEPPGGGPVPALRCGLGQVTAPWLLLLAADLPFVTGRWLTELLSLGAASGRPGAMLTDDGDRPQWLTTCWQTEPLRQAMHSYTGESLGGLLRPLDAALLRPGAVTSGSPGQPLPPWQDCDSPEELAAARSAAASGRPADIRQNRNGEA